MLHIISFDSACILLTCYKGDVLLRAHQPAGGQGSQSYHVSARLVFGRQPDLSHAGFALTPWHLPRLRLLPLTEAFVNTQLDRSTLLYFQLHTLPWLFRDHSTAF